MTALPAFLAIRTVGGLLPADTLAAVGLRIGLDGLNPADYHLVPGETLREAANRAWQRLLGAWRVFRDASSTLPDGDPATGLTRERWLLPLFSELGYGRLPTSPSGGLLVEDKAFPISHLWGANPIHLLGTGVDLDTRRAGVAGAAKTAPHAMVQELLNRTDAFLWAMLSNGRTLRILRDNTSLVRPAYVEFDLEAVFDGELFSEFVILYLVCHQSRVEPSEDAGRPSCWLEQWRTTSITAGTRALDQLRGGVVHALRRFGAGFLRHPSNVDLRAALASGELTARDYYRSLLRLVYRLLFIFVAEDRDLLHTPDTPAGTRDRYARYFSTARLRRLAARTRTADRHPDLWCALRLVFDGLSNDEGLPALGLPYLGGFLFDPAAAGPLARAEIANADVLAALRPLSLVRDRSGLTRNIDYRNLDSEELGSIYESLLELVPRHDPSNGEFRLDEVAGNERKTSGSYYTPSSLIACLLDTALDPLLDDAVQSGDSVAAEAALLDITVCDPACGSGHFLVAAARRIAKRLAFVRTGDPEPTPGALRTALRDVVGRCIYGVDLNALAAELAKVSLWLEALEPGKPLSFLDARIKVGNALLGTTPALLAAGIPDEAFLPLTGDEKRHTTDLKKRNRHERAHVDQLEMFDIDALHTGTKALAAQRAEIEQYDDSGPAGLAARAEAWRRLEASPELTAARQVADAWCAAFVWPRNRDAPAALTDRTLRKFAGGAALPSATAVELERIARDYKFFHWHLEFPDIFTVPDQLREADDAAHGWTGGFTCIVGNPPWERVKLQEQEFFAARNPDIAQAPNAAARRKMIQALVDDDPGLLGDFEAAKRRAEGESHLLRNSGRYPLCGVGDVNTYSVFAEHMRDAISPTGRMGVITPTGLATDATTASFFAQTLRAQRLVAFYDFENEAKIFPGVHNQFRFAITCMTGGEHVSKVRFAFYTRYLADVASRQFALAPDEVLLLNPNTGTLPLFRSRVDAEITLAVYRRHPVLVRDGTAAANPWGLRFVRLFDMANDSALFRTEADLAATGAEFDGWAWQKGSQRWLPLYEAKLLGHFDHRFATYEGASDAQLSKGTLPRLTDSQHGDPDAEPLARYWVAETDVAAAIRGRWDRNWFVGWRGIARASDSRTAIPVAFPLSAANHKVPLLLPTKPLLAPLLQCCWSSLAFDYVVRQKLSSTNLDYFVVKQLACPAPPSFEDIPAWCASPLQEWMTPRLVELMYSSHRMASYASDLGDEGPPFRWVPERREMLRAELDAAMFHLYGLTLSEVEHVLDSFFVVRKNEERDYGEFRTKRLVLQIYDAMAAAIATGMSYVTILDPPPGQGPRHPES